MTRLAISLLPLLLAAGCSSAPDEAPLRDESDKTVVYLRHAEAEDLADTLRRMGLPEEFVIADHADSNSLILSGDPKTVKQALVLIDRLDKPAG